MLWTQFFTPLYQTTNGKSYLISSSCMNSMTLFIQSYYISINLWTTTEEVDTISCSAKEEDIILMKLLLAALWYLRVWSQRARVLKLGQVRVFSTHFEKNKGQKVKLKGHQYSFLAALRVFVRVANTHFGPKQGYLPLRYSQFKILVIQYIFVYLFDNFIFLSLSF